MKRVWKQVFSSARQGEICCGLVGVEPAMIRLALIACIRAGVLTAGEVVRARPFWSRP